MVMWFVMPLSAHAQSKKPIVAVFDIEDKGVGLKRKLCERLSDYLAMTIAATGKYRVVPRDQLKKRLVAQKKQSYKKCYDQTCQIEIGKELAAQKSLTTVIMKLGSRCMVTSVLYNLRTAASEGGASTEGECSEDAIVESIKRVVKKMIPAETAAAARTPPVTRRDTIRSSAAVSGSEVGNKRKDGINVPLPGTCDLTINGAPAGAIVHVAGATDRAPGGGKWKCIGLPCKRSGIKKGHYQVFVKHPDFLANIRRIVLKKGEAKTIKVKLKKGKVATLVAKEYRDRSKSMIGASIRSFVAPGWGQFYLERKTSGIVYVSVAGALVLTGLIMVASGYADSKTNEFGSSVPADHAYAGFIVTGAGFLSTATIAAIHALFQGWTYNKDLKNQIKNKYPEYQKRSQVTGFRALVSHDNTMKYMFRLNLSF